MGFFGEINHSYRKIKQKNTLQYRVPFQAMKTNLIFYLHVDSIGLQSIPIQMYVFIRNIATHMQQLKVLINSTISILLFNEKVIF